MKKMIIAAGMACSAAVACTSTVAAQYMTDSLPASQDSFPPIKIQMPANEPRFKSTIAGWAVPAAMLGYGFLALNNHSLTDLNTSARNEIKEDHPHFNTGIDNFLQYSPAVAVYVLNAAGVHGKHNLRDRTVILGISALLTAGAVQGLKTWTHEERPDQTNYLSFPSGHTATAFAAAEFLRQEYKDVSPWYGVAGYAAATATGALRMYNNRHWLSDVVAGAGLGILCTKAAYWMYPFIQRKLFPAHQDKFVVMPYYNAQWRTAGVNMTVISFGR
ncbi:phosphatase PAP2 family protein [Chitinophaga vietnamensis]|uniref:phosphatase PAP2 family protein n=1 Tax=Chitinophaga vietnamensis TaxID=2593957 RepID=UPI001F24A6AF|nr:phosphatase PAP2 family protein [Chitinophaga vietnamensis]